MNHYRFLAMIGLVAGVLCTVPSAAWASASDLQAARQYIRQKQFDQAQQRIDEHLSGNSRDPEGRLLRGVVLSEQGKTGEAIKLFSDLTREFPRMPEPHNNLAAIYAAQGQYDKARAALEAALATHPSYEAAFRNLSEMYSRMATAAYGRALHLDKPNNPVTLAWLTEISAAPKAGEKPVQIAQAETRVKVEPRAAAPVVAPAPPAAPALRPPAAVDSAPAAPALRPPAPATPTPVPTLPEVKPRPEPRPVEIRPEPPRVEKDKPQPAASDDGPLLAVQGWAKAWSAKDVDGYLAFYAREFRTPGGEKRGEWEKSRRERINAPKSIKVSVASPKVSMQDSNHASVTFRQNYDAGHLKTSTTKTLVLVRNGRKWQITEEKIGR